MTYSADEHDRRRQRAELIAQQLAGSRATHGVIRALLALVVADERTDLPLPERSQPAPGARQILQTPAVQEALW